MGKGPCLTGGAFGRERKNIQEGPPSRHGVWRAGHNGYAVRGTTSVCRDLTVTDLLGCQGISAYPVAGDCFALIVRAQ